MRSPDCPSLLAVFSLALAAGPLAAQELIVTSHQPPAVKVFDLRLSGDVAPERQVSGASTGLVTLYAAEVDRSRREIFVADFGGNAVRVFPVAADGDVAPLREIAGPSTQLNKPIGIALDPLAGELFVRLYNTSKVLVFPLGAQGDIEPSRVLLGAFAASNGRGIAVDPQRGELLLTEQLDAGAIHVFPIGASGAVVPVRTIAGPSTRLVEPSALKLDLTHDELLVIANGEILTFGRGQSGDVAPTRFFSLANALTPPAGVEIDPVPDEIVVSGQSTSGRLYVYPRTTTGAGALPLREIAGAATGLHTNTMLALLPTPRFADGFEDATTDAWSSSQP